NGVVNCSTPISRIDIEPDRVLVTPDKAAPVAADVVVLAVPPTVWKYITVNPGIPDDYRIAMGVAVKYLSRSSSRSWINEGKAPSATSDEVGVTWEGTDNQMQAPGQDVELTVFAGGSPARRALGVYEQSGMDGVRAFYDQAIGRFYEGYPGHRKA